MNDRSAACPFCGQDVPAQGSAVQRCSNCGKQLVAAFDDHGEILELWVPAELQGHVVVSAAGRGSVGWVFRGRDQISGRPVAIQFLERDRGTGADVQQRFQKEIEALRSLEHPNLARYYGHGTKAGLSYYVMEWIDGESLAKVLETCRQRQSGLPFQYVIPLFQQLCRALKALHKRGIMHGNMKPSSILVTTGKSVKLIDLGVARLACKTARSAATTVIGRGTYEYMAPEQLGKGGTADHRADIYALGRVVYEMLTGYLPRGSVCKPSLVNPTVPSEFDQIVLAMMEQAPENRPSLGDLLPEEPAPKAKSLGQFSCPGCKSILQAPAGMTAGSQVHCPICSTLMRIPGTSAGPPAPAQDAHIQPGATAAPIPPGMPPAVPNPGNQQSLSTNLAGQGAMAAYFQGWGPLGWLLLVVAVVPLAYKEHPKFMGWLTVIVGGLLALLIGYAVWFDDPSSRYAHLPPDYRNPGKPLPVSTDYRPAKWADKGWVLSLTNKSDQTFAKVRARVNNRGGLNPDQPFKVLIGSMEPSKTIEVGWLEMDKPLLQGDLVEIWVDGFDLFLVTVGPALPFRPMPAPAPYVPGKPLYPEVTPSPAQKGR